MRSPEEPAPASAAAVAGLARQVEALRRTVEDLQALPNRVDDLGRMTSGLADGLAAVKVRSGPATAPTWLMHPMDPWAARAVLDGLTAWLQAVHLRYTDAAATLPECWLWHPDVIEELLWLMHSWLAAYQGAQASVALAADWHDRYRPGAVRRIKAAAGMCSLENHRGDRANGVPEAPLAGAVQAIANWWGTYRHEPAPEPTNADLAAAPTRRTGSARR